MGVGSVDVADFIEVGDRTWVARYDPWDVNVCVVGGDRGLLVVDTRASEEQATELLADLRRLRPDPIVGVVNTHDHHDHVRGNRVVAADSPGTELVCHEDAAPRIADQGEGLVGNTFSGVRTIDLGDRHVELLHPGRGHTAGDLVALVPDAGVLLAGDLVEESGPPGFGDDCHPLAWPETLDLVLQVVTDSTVVVPGHGAPVDRRFVHDQRLEIGTVAQQVQELAANGVPEREALAAGEWPWPPEVVRHAVTNGYAHLPRSGRRLPLA